MLPDCRAEDAIEIVERPRAATPGVRPARRGWRWGDRGESVDELVARADKALYEADELGRDRPVSAAV